MIDLTPLHKAIDALAGALYYWQADSDNSGAIGVMLEPAQLTWQQRADLIDALEMSELPFRVDVVEAGTIPSGMLTRIQLKAADLCGLPLHAHQFLTLNIQPKPEMRGLFPADRGVFATRPHRQRCSAAHLARAMLG